MSRVLLAYAPSRGGTRHVAESIAMTLEAEGALVRMAPVAAVCGSVAGWDLIVLGAPLHWGRWHGDAHHFLTRHRNELITASVAVFGLGGRYDDDQAWQRGRSQLDRALADHPWLTPVAIGLFGCVDRAGRHSRRIRIRDDWAEIGVWARKVHAVTQPIR